MRISAKYFKTALPFLALLCLASACPLRADLAATAQITDTQVSPGVFQYDVTLNDTGTTNIGTFWFSWVPGQDFMPVAPTGVLAPSSWVDQITHGGPSDGFAIRWVDTGAALTPGNSLSGFQFDSTMTPAQLEGLSAAHPAFPVGTSFVYIGAPFGDPGEQFVASVVPTSTPEPSSMLFTALGIGVLALIRRWSL